MTALRDLLETTLLNLRTRWQEWRADDDEPVMDHWRRVIEQERR